VSSIYSGKVPSFGETSEIINAHEVYICVVQVSERTFHDPHKTGGGTITGSITNEDIQTTVSPSNFVNTTADDCVVS
jgi:hypothetical protein